MNEAHRLACLELALTPHIGPISFLKLLQVFQDASVIWHTPLEQLQHHLNKPAALAVSQRLGKAALHAALAWQQQHPDNHLISLIDETYPMSLAQIDAPPPLLFGRGQIDLLNSPAVAIIGSRHATASGLAIAAEWAATFTEYGITVVSGFAAGIDTAAHRGAAQAKGNTIAILGTGIDRVYPAANRELAHQISQHGLLLSEFPLGTAPIAHNFPRRNRIIAGLASAIIVVEASLESGSLITARLGLEQNKEVMAIPGSIHNPQSKGCHALIKQGAKLVECVEDVLEECLLLPQTRLQDAVLSVTNPNDSKVHHQIASPILESMGFDPIHPDQLVDKLGISATDVYAELLQLELQGKIAALAGGRYQRIT